jgi:hypothetical protein
MRYEQPICFLPFGYLLWHRSPEPNGHGRLFMFERIVPPSPGQLQRVRGDKKAFDMELRPGLMVRSIRELQTAG